MDFSISTTIVIWLSSSMNSQALSSINTECITEYTTYICDQKTINNGDTQQ